MLCSGIIYQVSKLVVVLFCRPEGSLSPVHSSKAPDDLMATQDASFDPDKTLCCKVENGHTLMHGTGGRGYGLGATCITSGCYQWKVRSSFTLSEYEHEIFFSVSLGLNMNSMFILRKKHEDNVAFVFTFTQRKHILKLFNGKGKPSAV